MPRGPGWTREEEAQLAELAAQGLQWAEVAARLPGRSPQACHAVARRLRREGRLATRPANPRPVPQGAPRAPLPGSRLDVLLRHIRRRAAEGRPLETTGELVALIGAGHLSQVSALLAELRARGLVVVEYAPAGIARVAAPDGSWEVRGSAAGRAEGGTRRRCLCCRQVFEAEHRTNFVCGGCKGLDAWRAGVAA